MRVSLKYLIYHKLAFGKVTDILILKSNDVDSLLMLGNIWYHQSPFPQVTPPEWTLMVLFSPLGFLYESTRAAITKHHRLSGLNNRDLFSHSSGGWSPRSGYQQGWFQRLREGSAPGLFPWCADSTLSLSSDGLPCVCVQCSLSYKDTSHMGWRPIPMTSF